MFLKKENFNNLDPVINFFRRKKDLLVVLIILIVLLSGAATYRWLARTNILHNIVKPTLKMGRELPIHYFYGLFSNPEKISIDIKFKDYQQILQKRNEALEVGLLFSSNDDYVPATIHYNKEEIPVNIRLKGDSLDHIAGDKWSFRIKVKGDNALFGMSRFSIQSPERRYYVDEWVFHQFLKKEGLPFLRYKFIEVTLNGKKLGVYAVEEHFSGELLANNKLLEGPILKFDESLFFDLVLRSENPARAHTEDPQDMIYISNPIDVFESSKLGDPVFFSQFITAKNLLEGFRRGFLKSSQVFDIEKMAKFYAIVDMINATHAVGWTNVRLYYNPVTSLLEPIGYDAFTNLEGPINDLTGYPKTETLKDNSIHDFKFEVFKDTVFFAEYLKQLDRISKPGYIESFFDEIGEELTNNLHIIWRDKPLYSFSRYSNTSTDNVYKNREYIRNALNPVVGIRAYLKESYPIPIVEVANIQPLPIMFQGKLLPGRVPHTPLIFQDFELNKLTDTLNYKILGMDTVLSANIIPWSALDSNEITRTNKRRIPNYYLFNFLLVDYGKKTISIKPGSWSITRDLVTPPDFTFVAGPGTEIDILNSARIISYSPLRFIGDENRPVKIASSDKTSKGVWVYAPEKSYLENIVITNNLLNFYESPSYIKKAYFSGPSSYDDSLHIIRSDFELVDSSFKDIFADALDIDFGNGEISGTSFNNLGNDAIDFSGSIIKIYDSQIKNAGDKGISAGEDSQIEARNLTITDSNICLASKDLSVFVAENLVLENCEVGIAVFEKKPEFGPGQAIISGLEIKNVVKEFLVEKGSSLGIDGVAIEDSETNLKEKLYVE